MFLTHCFLHHTQLKQQSSEVLWCPLMGPRKNNFNVRSSKKLSDRSPHFSDINVRYGTFCPSHQGKLSANVALTYYVLHPGLYYFSAEWCFGEGFLITIGNYSIGKLKNLRKWRFYFKQRIEERETERKWKITAVAIVAAAAASRDSRSPIRRLNKKLNGLC